MSVSRISAKEFKGELRKLENAHLKLHNINKNYSSMINDMRQKYDQIFKYNQTIAVRDFRGRHEFDEYNRQTEFTVFHSY